MRFKHYLTILIAISLTGALYAFLPEKGDAVAHISFPVGKVSVVAQGETKLKKARFNKKLYNGDKVKTAKNSRCEIKFADGSVVRIDQNSIYTIEQSAISQKSKKVNSSLSIGSLWANIKKLVTSNDSWNLRGPSAVVAVRGTIYRMEAAADKTAKVLVYEGSVNVNPSSSEAVSPQQQKSSGKPTQINGPTQIKGPSVVSLKQWVEIVKAQQQIVVKPDGSYKKTDFSLEEDAKSSWVKWNLERDKLIK